jgi:hypothetical protein
MNAVSAAISLALLALGSFAAHAETIPDKATHFACAPTKLHHGNVLSISVSVPHGTDLGIWSPKKEFFFVYSCDDQIRAPGWKDVDCAAFANLSRITIDTSSFEAAAASPGAGTKRVFSANGAYTVLLAKNLETENTARSTNRCIVQYTGKMRPAY